MEKALSWIRGTTDQEYENAVQVLRENSGVHINILKKLHPWHPYDPKMEKSHPCFQPNEAAGKCFQKQVDEYPEAGLHWHHVNCFEPKSDLMVCLTRYRRRQREQQQQQPGASQTEAQTPIAGPASSAPPS
eukprot:RCo039114